MLLNGRVAVVTGGGRGIGLQTASSLAAHGARVMVVDAGTAVSSTAERDPSVAAAAVAEIRKQGGEAMHSDADVTDTDAMTQVLAAAAERWGPVDILVNAAGIIRDRMVWNVPDEEWDDVQRVHVRGCFATTRALARALRNSETPPEAVSILNFASSAGVFGVAGSSAYGAAKSAVIGFTRVVSMELAALNVRANCIVPFAWTRMAAELPTNGTAESERVQRLQQLTPEGVAHLVVALAASTDADLTGQVIGLRGREMLLFAQPAISSRVVLSSVEVDQVSKALHDSVRPLAQRPVPSPEIFDYEPF